MGGEGEGGVGGVGKKCYAVNSVWGEVCRWC